jgi:hypothetical protein
LPSETLAGCALILASAVFISFKGSENIKEGEDKTLF